MNRACLSLALLPVAFLGAAGALAQSSIRVIRPNWPIPVVMDIHGQLPPSQSLDLNADGRSDLLITRSTEGASLWCQDNQRLVALPQGAFDVGSYLYPLAASTLIQREGAASIQWTSTNAPLGQARCLLSACFGVDAVNPGGIECLGLFHQTNAYAGFELNVDGRRHYGWLHLDAVHLFPSVGGGFLLEWAYETRPDTPIRAGARPVAVPVISAKRHAGSLRLRWAAEPGRRYQVQRKPDLSAESWANLDFILPATGSNLVVDLPVQAGQGFYQVVEADARAQP